MTSYSSLLLGLLLPTAVLAESAVSAASPTTSGLFLPPLKAEGFKAVGEEAIGELAGAEHALAGTLENVSGEAMARLAAALEAVENATAKRASLACQACCGSGGSSCYKAYRGHEEGQCCNRGPAICCPMQTRCEASGCVAEHGLVRPPDPPPPPRHPEKLVRPLLLLALLSAAGLCLAAPMLCGGLMGGGSLGRHGYDAPPLCGGLWSKGASLLRQETAGAAEKFIFSPGGPGQARKMLIETSVTPTGGGGGRDSPWPGGGRGGGDKGDVGRGQKLSLPVGREWPQLPRARGDRHAGAEAVEEVEVEERTPLAAKERGDY